MLFVAICTDMCTSGGLTKLLGDFREQLLVFPLQLGAQPLLELRMDLADAALGDSEDGADLAQGQAVYV